MNMNHRNDMPEKDNSEENTSFRILHLLKTEGELSSADIRASIGMSDDINFTYRILAPMIKAGILERTIPNKPTSRSQKYRITAKGQKMLKEHS